MARTVELSGRHLVRFSRNCSLLLFLSPLLLASNSPGTKMTVRRISPGYSSETTAYWQGDRKRLEYRNSSGNGLGPHIATITRCDLKRMFELNLDSSEYASAPHPPKPLTKQQMHARGLDQQTISWSEKPMLRIEIKTVDTHERKQLFGHTARHVITTRKQIPLEGSRSQPEETVQDGWYIDLDQEISCDPLYLRNTGSYSAFAFLSVNQTHETRTMDRPEFVHVGQPERGFALEEVTTSDTTYRSTDGTTKHARSKGERVVTELYEGPLDPALFEVPHGFRHVEEIDHNSPRTPLSPVREFWERVKYTVANWFSFD
jgi:hypothetical protein